MSDQSTSLIDPKAGSTANIIYILYLANIIVGLTALIGLVMAYVNQSQGPDWVRAHYRFQIRTFWIAFLVGVIGAVTTFIVVGWIILLLLLIWWIIRCVKGMQYLGRQQPYPNLETWLF